MAADNARRCYTEDRLGEIPSCGIRKDSVDNQLFDLRAVAYRLGLNDAAGIMNVMMASPLEKRDLSRPQTIKQIERRQYLENQDLPDPASDNP